jgi:Lrp/AsnC family transcriptional regulator, leucine-responsive regulatory protein
MVEATLNEQQAERLDSFEILLLNEPALTRCYRGARGPDLVLIEILKAQ